METLKHIVEHIGVYDEGFHYSEAKHEDDSSYPRHRQFVDHLMEYYRIINPVATVVDRIPEQRMRVILHDHAADPHIHIEDTDGLRDCSSESVVYHTGLIHSCGDVQAEGSGQPAPFHVALGAKVPADSINLTPEQFKQRTTLFLEHELRVLKSIAKDYTRGSGGGLFDV
jgi:hypothetical protein